MSALAKRKSIQRLVTLVPEKDLDTVEGMLRGLVSGDPVLAAFRNAPLDDEETTEDDVTALEEAKMAEAEGRVYSHEDVMRDLGL